jgi:biopolymer transport protein TolR
MSEINMTPLIDVMLVLLVIFILAAPLIASALRLDLPTASAATAHEVQRAVRVGLDKTGQIYLDEQPLSLDQLQQHLNDVARQSQQAEIQLRADEAVPYGRVVAIIDAARQAGLSRVGFVAKP